MGRELSRFAFESVGIDIPTELIDESNSTKLVYLAIPSEEDAFTTQAKIHGSTGVPQATVASSCKHLVELGAVEEIKNPPKYNAQKGYRRADAFVSGGEPR